MHLSLVIGNGDGNRFGRSWGAGVLNICIALLGMGNVSEDI